MIDFDVKENEVKNEPAPLDGKSFDFTVSLEMMDDTTKSVYYRLRRVALTAPGGEFKADNGKGDASLLPDGKVYTESEVVEILGPDYLAGLVINTKCCN